MKLENTFTSVRKSIKDQGGIWVPVTSPHSARAFVWAIWLLLLLIDLGALVIFGRIIPNSEDWLLIAPLTGHEPSLAHWLWEPNNEHRLPLPRLILLGLLKLTGGEWRISMLFSIILFAIVAAAFIWIAFRLRNGRTIFADAIFPITLLSLGNWENLFWTWPLTQNIPTVLTCVILLLIVNIKTLIHPVSWFIAGGILIILPLSGVNGLLILPFTWLFFVYYAWLYWRKYPHDKQQRRAVTFLLIAALISAAISVFYLKGLQQSEWMLPNPGLASSIKAVLKFLALAFGPAARSAWEVAIVLMLLLFVPATIIMVRAVIRFLGTEEETRSVGLLTFFGSGLLFALVLGFGRAGVIGIMPGWKTWPIRYAHFVAPLLFAVYFVWLLYFPPKLASLSSSILLVFLLLLLPLNALHGYDWQYWISQRDHQLLAQIRTGASIDTIVELIHADYWQWVEPREVEENVRWLIEDGIPPFHNFPASPVNQEELEQKSMEFAAESAGSWPLVQIRYRFPRASEVFLFWGINDWQQIPDQFRPADTVLDTIFHIDLMKSPMVLEDDAFVARVKAPPGTALNYGFQIKGIPKLFPEFISWDFAHKKLSVGEDDLILNVNPHLKQISGRIILAFVAIGVFFIFLWALLVPLIPLHNNK